MANKKSTQPAPRIEPIPSDPGVMIVGKPGDPIPEGYESVPRIKLSGPATAEGGMAITPAIYRAMIPDQRATKLQETYIGFRGAAVKIQFGDGRVRPMWLLSERDAADPLFSTLKPRERKAIAAHFREVSHG